MYHHRSQERLFEEYACVHGMSGTAVKLYEDGEVAVRWGDVEMEVTVPSSFSGVIGRVA